MDLEAVGAPRQSVWFAHNKTFFLEEKIIEEVSDEASENGSLVALDVKKNFVLASRSSLTEPSRLVIIPLTPKPPGASPKVISSPRSVPGIPLDWQEQWTFLNPYPPAEVVSNSPVPALYFGPTQLPSGEYEIKPVWREWVDPKRNLRNSYHTICTTEQNLNH